MNIAFYAVTPLRLTKEATSITILSLARELRLRGHEVMIIAPGAEKMPSYQEIEKVPIFRFQTKIPLVGKIIQYPLFLRKIQKEKGVTFDIIHSFSANPLFAFPAICSKLLFPRVKLIHTLKSYPRGVPSFYYILLNLVRLITVPTTVFKSTLQNVSQCKIKVVHSSIDAAKFKPLDTKELRKKYNYNDKDKILLYYGSMHEHKGVDVLIKALTLIKKEELSLRVIIAPRYTEITKEKDMVKEAGADGFTTFITEDILIEEYINLADVVVLPYTSLIATEGNPSCLLECIACKTPVVTTSLPELQEIVAHDQDVLMAIPGDPISLANQVLRLLKDTTLQQRLTEKAYTTVQKFDIKEVATQFVELYQIPE